MVRTEAQRGYIIIAKGFALLITGVHLPYDGMRGHCLSASPRVCLSVVFVSYLCSLCNTIVKHVEYIIDIYCKSHPNLVCVQSGSVDDKTCVW